MRRLSNVILVGIAIVCIGFILSNCGAGPTLKTTDPEAGDCALNFPFPSSIDLQQYMSAGHGASMSSSSDITVEAWIKSSSTYNLNRGTIFARGVKVGGINQDLTSDRILLGVTASSGEFMLAHATGAAPLFEYRVTSTNTVAADSNWHHVAGVFTTSAHIHTATAPTSTCSVAAMSGSHIDVYVDGVFTNCRGLAVTALPIILDEWDTAGNGDSVTPNAVGRDIGSAVGDNFSGTIDEVRLWKEARDKSVLLVASSTNYIAAWKDRTLTPEADPNGTLVGYWKFDECRGNTVADWSGLGYSGTLLICNTPAVVNGGTCGSTTSTPGLAESNGPWGSGWVSGLPF